MEEKSNRKGLKQKKLIVRPWLFVGVLLFSFSWSVSAAERKDPLGLICFISGEIRLRENGGKERSPALYDPLREGDEIRTRAEALVKIVLFNGEFWEMGGSSRATLRQGKVQSLQGEVRCLPPVAILPEIAVFDRENHPGRRMAALRIRGSEPLPVADNRVELPLPAPDKDQKYYMAVADSSGKVIFSGAVESTLCTLPERTLLPGQDYFFQVWSEREQIRPPLIRWRPLRALSEEDARARKVLYGRYQETGEVALLLLLAEWDRILGLSYSAEQEFKEALGQHPNNPALHKTRERFSISE